MNALWSGLANPPAHRPGDPHTPSEVVRKSRQFGGRKAAANRRSKRWPEIPNPWGLTACQCRVLALVAEGKTNVEIGRALNIAAKTVEVHRSHILTNMEVRTSIQAAVLWDRFARGEGHGA